MWQDELSQKSYVEPDVYFISILYDDILVKAIKMQKVVEVEYLVLECSVLFAVVFEEQESWIRGIISLCNINNRKLK